MTSVITHIYTITHGVYTYYCVKDCPYFGSEWKRIPIEDAPEIVAAHLSKYRESSPGQSWGACVRANDVIFLSNLIC